MAKEPESPLDDDLFPDDEEIDLESLLAQDGDHGDDEVNFDELLGDVADDSDVPEASADALPPDLPAAGADAVEEVAEAVSEAPAAAAAASAEDAKPKPKAKKVRKAKAERKKPVKVKKAKPAKAAKKRPAAAAARPASAGRGAYAFVCSECYDEYLLPANYSHETMTCPECLHVGKKPDENFLRTVAMHKKGQRKATFAVALCGVLFAAALLGLVYVSTVAGYDRVPEMNRSLVTSGFAGASGLLGLLFFWLAVRYEGNRWEVYF